MSYGFTYTLPTITGSHTDLPVVLKATDFPAAAIDGGSSSILNGGGNLRAYTSSAKTTQLPVEVVRFVTGGSPDIKVRVSLPTTATGSTIYIEADDTATDQPSANSAYGSEAVYNSNYLAAFVRPLINDSIPDSTSNANNFIARSVTGRTRAYIGKHASNTTAVPVVHQCVTYDGENFYAIDNNLITKHATLSGAAVATNNDPCGDVHVTCNHLGAGAVYSAYLYVPVEYFGGCGSVTHQYIARYNAADLTYVGAWDVSAQGHEVAALTIDPAAGTNGIIYVVSYCDNTAIYKYDLSDGTYLGAITLTGMPYGVNYYQGVALRGEKFLVSHPGSNISTFSAAGAYQDVALITSGNYPANPESVCVYGNTLYWWDGAPGTEAMYIYDLIGANGEIALGEVASAFELPVTLPDSGTISWVSAPNSFFSYNTQWDNSVEANDWESWIYSDRRIAARVNDAAPAYPYLASGSETNKHYFSFTWARSGSSVTQEFFVNGVSQGSNSQTWVTPGTSLYLNGGHASNTAGKSTFYGFNLSDVVRSDDYIATEYANQSATGAWGTVGTWADSGGAGVTGTLTATESGTDALSSTGSVLVAGTLTTTESGLDTASISGSVLVSGTLAVTEVGTDTFSASGSQSISGTLSATETGTDSAAITGAVLVSGSFAATESGIDSLIASGDIVIQGVLSATETGSDTFIATGSDISSGTLAATETGVDTFASTGAVVISGDVVASETGADDLSAVGSVFIHGALAADEVGADSMSASGFGVISGSLSAAETGLDVFSSTVAGLFLSGNRLVWDLAPTSYTWDLPERSYTWEIQ